MTLHQLGTSPAAAVAWREVAWWQSMPCLASQPGCPMESWWHRRKTWQRHAESTLAALADPMQSAAYTAAFASLFDSDVHKPVRARLATQLAVPIDDPVIVAIMSGMPQLGARAALLAVRGATNSVATGARLQLEGARCAFCHDAEASLAHYMACRTMLGALCEALGCPEQPHLVAVLRASSEPPARLWAAFVDLVATTSASRSEVVARSPAFGRRARAGARRESRGDGRGQGPPHPRSSPAARVRP